MQTISSKQNSHVRHLRSLRDTQARTETGCFLLEGWNLIHEALSFASVNTILVDEAKRQALENLPLDSSDKITILCAPSFILDHICQTKTPQGIVASARMPEQARMESIHGNILALDGVQDPGNVGTLIRTAEAAGFCAVLLSSECADPFALKTVRATMGSIFRMPLLRGNLLEMLSTLRQKGFYLISAELHGDSIAKAIKAKREPFALMIGSEGNGVSKSISMLSDLRVALPMRGKVESLNAAVAASILLYAMTFLPSDTSFSPHAE